MSQELYLKGLFFRLTIVPPANLAMASPAAVSHSEVALYLAALEHATEIDDYKKIRAIFLNTVSGFNPDTEIADAMYS